MKKFVLVLLLVLSSTAYSDGMSLYKSACFACHDNAVAGSPKFGDIEQWKPRIATGMDAMVKTVITGKGAMPPNGGTQFTEAQIKEVVEYMANSAK